MTGVDLSSEALAKQRSKWLMGDGSPTAIALIDAFEEARAALREIAAQKLLSELRADGTFSQWCADIEGGYEACIVRARTALFNIETTEQILKLTTEWCITCYNLGLLKEMPSL